MTRGWTGMTGEIVGEGAVGEEDGADLAMIAE